MVNLVDMLREATKKVIFLLARPLPPVPHPPFNGRATNKIAFLRLP